MIAVARFLARIASRDGERRMRALKSLGDALIPDFRLTAAQLDWWHDAEFNAYLDHFGLREGFSTHRKWMLWQLMRLAYAVEGDTAECGVFQGASSWLICAANRGRERSHHLFDSFEGLSAPGPEDGNYWKSGALGAGEDIVRANLEPFEGSFVIHKGWIPERFHEVEDRTFAFVHVDVDLHQPTLDSLKFFYPKLAPGGMFLCDDYGFTTCPGATEAIDSFLVDKQEKMIALDAGGGFFIKEVPVTGLDALLNPDRDR